MTGFNDMVRAQAKLAHNHLGGVTGDYVRRGVVIFANATAIIDEDIMEPEPDGRGIQSMIVASFRKDQIPSVKKDDEFVVGNIRYVVNRKYIEDDTGIEAIVRKIGG